MLKIKELEVISIHKSKEKGITISQRWDSFKVHIILEGIGWALVVVEVNLGIERVETVLQRLVEQQQWDQLLWTNVDECKLPTSVPVYLENMVAKEVFLVNVIIFQHKN